MGLLNLVLSLVCIGVFGLVLALFVVGWNAVRPTDWSTAIYEAGLLEAERRRCHEPAASQAALIAANRLIGPKPPDANGSDVPVAAIGALIQSANIDELEKELDALRSDLRQSALERQVALVDGVASIRVASYLWVLRRVGSEASFGVSGLMWFVKRSKSRLSKIALQSLAVVGAICSVLGVMAAGLAGPSHVFSVLSVSAGIGVVAGVATTAFVIVRPLLAYRLGPVQGWTTAAICRGLAVVAATVAVPGLFLSGLLNRWIKAVPSWLAHLHPSHRTSLWLSGMVMLVVVGYFMRNAWRWASLRAMKLSDRAGSAMCLVILACAFVSVVLMLVGAPRSTEHAVLLWSGGALLATVGAAAVLSVAEWVQKYLKLRRAGHPIGQGWFRWWALVAWTALLIITVVLAALAGPVDQIRPGSTAQALSTSSELTGVVCFIAFVPGAVITRRFVRSVDKAYADFIFEQSPEHPYLTANSSPLRSSRPDPSQPE